ncbi:Mitogen-activated protein kinase kinase 7 [Linum perenne]
MCVTCFGEAPPLPEEASVEFKDFIKCCLQKDSSQRLTSAMLLQICLIVFVFQQKCLNPNCSVFNLSINRFNSACLSAISPCSGPILRLSLCFKICLD